MKNLQNTRFIYISTLEYCNVFVTQVIDWLHAYQEKGIVFELWRISSINKILRAEEIKESQLIRTIYKGKVRKLYHAPPHYFIGFIFDTLLLAYLLIPDLIKNKTIIIQIRSASLWKPLKYLKMISPKKVKIIFDSRAAAAEEVTYSNRNNCDQLKMKIERISMDEIKMIQLSDKTFCVSNVLIDYHLKKNPKLIKSKIYLYPCSANSSHFFYSPEFRSEIRKQYQLEKRKVIVYSGGLKLPWHIPDKIFDLFAGLYALDENYFLILLSPDTEIAELYLEEYKIPKDSAIITSVSNSEVVKYLCAADIALLLRDDIPMNNVSSPTKFAEYIMTGLPVIISKNVGDFSGFVAENDLGYVFNNDISTNIYLELHVYFDKKAGLYFSRRKDIAELGLNRYSKNINIDSIIAQYYSLIP